MKKTIIIIALVLIISILSACSSSINNKEVSKSSSSSSNVQLLNTSSEESLATLSYLSTGFFDVDLKSSSSNLSVMANGKNEKTAIENDLETVNVYFDRLKSIIDNGIENFVSITEQVMDDSLYDYILTFTVNDEIYLIKYNINQETFEMSGIIVIGNIEYDFQVVDNLRDYKYQLEDNDSKNISNSQSESSSSIKEEVITSEVEKIESSSSNGIESEPSASEIIESTSELIEESDNSSTTESSINEDTSSIENSEINDINNKMILVAHNGDDFIKIIYKTEIEEDEAISKFYMSQEISGVKKELSLKINVDENKYKVTLEENQDRYMFMQITEDDSVMYKLNYTVNKVTGMVKIKENQDELGNIIYTYHITEANKGKIVSINKPTLKGKGQENSSSNKKTAYSI